MEAVTHLEKVITGEVSAVTHLEKVIAQETSAVTYTEKVIAGEATPITHLQKVIAGVASPVTHLEQVWAGGSPTPSEHEYTGAVPVTITADGTPLLDYTIYGNTVQSGTPTPSNPIQPSECGERTGNLFDGQLQQGFYSYASGNFESANAYVCTVLIPCEGNSTYTFRCINTGGGSKNYGYVFYNSAKNRIGSDYINELTKGDVVTHTATTPQNTAFLAINIAYGRRQPSVVRPSDIADFMLNEGSTALPFEPYGYKIPISSNSTTTPVYLGEVQTTRKIKKYEFTGQESIGADLTYSRFFFTLNNSLIIGARKTPAFCTHWQVIDDGRPIADVPNNALYSDSGNSRWFIKTTDYTTADDFKSYLAAQYAAGTPVTAWYVLATEDPGIVNEPLRKIGDYADTLSMEQAGVSIPTLNGQTVIDVETTLKPSEMYIKYNG